MTSPPTLPRMSPALPARSPPPRPSRPAPRLIRRKLKHYLPTPESIRDNRWLRWCAPLLAHPRLWHLHRRAVALGVAIGLVTGLIPGPIQMLLAAIIAIPLRANIPGSRLHHPLHQSRHLRAALHPRLQHRRVGDGGLRAAGRAAGHGLNWEGLRLLFATLLTWIASMGDTLLIGLAIQCTFFAVAGYSLTMIVWRVIVTRAWRTRRATRRRPA